jgi:hypothetical protein
MATVYLAVEVDREEGKFVSNETVGEELMALIDGESVDVEDSVYNVTSVEVVASPKTASKPVMGDKDLLLLDEALTLHHQAFPPDLGDDGAAKTSRDNLTLTQAAFVYAFEKLMYSSAVGEAIRKAKVRQSKPAKSEQDKRLDAIVRERYPRTKRS